MAIINTSKNLIKMNINIKINIPLTIKPIVQTTIRDIIIMKKMIKIKKKASLIINIITINTEIGMIMKIEGVIRNIKIQKKNHSLIQITHPLTMIY